MELTQIQQLILAMAQLRETTPCLKSEKRPASKMLSEHEKFSYAAMNSKHRKIRGLSKPRIKKQHQIWQWNYLEKVLRDTD